MRTHFRLFSCDHEPSQRLSSATLSSSVRSGITDWLAEPPFAAESRKHMLTESVLELLLQRCQLDLQHVLPLALRSPRPACLFQGLNLVIVLA